MEREQFYLLPYSLREEAAGLPPGRTYLLAPTESASAWHLAKAGLGHRLFDVNRGACAAARREGRPVAAVLGPIRERSFGVLYAHYHEQVKALILTDPDIFVLQGMDSLENLRAACVAVRELFGDRVLYVSDAISEEASILCAGFGVLPASRSVRAHCVEALVSGSGSRFWWRGVRFALGPGLPAACVRHERTRIFVGRHGAGSIEVLWGNPSSLETMLRGAPGRPIVLGGVPGTRAARLRMHIAARFGAGILVPLAGSGEAGRTLVSLVERAAFARREAAEAGIPDGGLLLDLTGEALELADGPCLLRAVESVRALGAGPVVGFGRLPPACGSVGAFLARAAALGACFLPASSSFPEAVVGRSAPRAAVKPLPVLASREA